MRFRLVRAALPLTLLALAACEKEAPNSGRVETPAAPAKPAARVEGTTPGELVPKFAVEGTAAGAKAPAFDSQAPGQVTVYCVGSTTCPYTNKYAEKLQQIEEGFAGKPVRFVWLYSNSTEPDADKTKWHAEKGLAGVFVIDRGAVAAKALGAARTPELVVTSADGTITYRGAIDDGSGDPKRAKVEYLRDAIDATLAGRPVTTTVTQPAG